MFQSPSFWVRWINLFFLLDRGYPLEKVIWSQFIYCTFFSLYTCNLILLLWEYNKVTKVITRYFILWLICLPCVPRRAQGIYCACVGRQHGCKEIYDVDYKHKQSIYYFCFVCWLQKKSCILNPYKKYLNFVRVGGFFGKGGGVIC